MRAWSPHRPTKLSGNFRRGNRRGGQKNPVTVGTPIVRESIAQVRHLETVRMKSGMMPSPSWGSGILFAILTLGGFFDKAPGPSPAPFLDTGFVAAGALLLGASA